MMIYMRVYYTYHELVASTSPEELLKLDNKTKIRLFNLLAREKKYIQNITNEVKGWYYEYSDMRGSVKEIMYDSMQTIPANERHLYHFLDNLSTQEKQNLSHLYKILDKIFQIYKIMTLAVGRSVRGADDRNKMVVEPFGKDDPEFIQKEVDKKGNDIDLLWCPAMKILPFPVFDDTDGNRKKGILIEAIEGLLKENNIKYKFSIDKKKNGTDYWSDPFKEKGDNEKVTIIKTIKYHIPNFIIYFEEWRPIHLSLEERLSGQDKIKDEYIKYRNTPYAILTRNSAEARSAFSEIIQKHEEGTLERFDKYPLVDKIERFRNKKREGYKKNIENTIRKNTRIKQEKERHKLIREKIILKDEWKNTDDIDKKLNKLVEDNPVKTGYEFGEREAFNPEHIKNPEGYKDWSPFL